MTAAVSEGAVCCLNIHFKASKGSLQQVRAAYASYGGTFGGSLYQSFPPGATARAVHRRQYG